jgi:hypothetical protein
MYISGHDEFCTRGTADRLSTVEGRLLTRIEELEERVRQLEETQKTRQIAAEQLGRRYPG